MALQRRIPRRPRPALCRRHLPHRPGYCESYGHDLFTGATVGAESYRATAAGKAVLKTADYLPPHEEPDGHYPFRFTTGRTATISTPGPRPAAPGS